MFVRAMSTAASSTLLPKCGMVMHCYELECHAEKLACYFQGQGHSEGSCDQNMTVSMVSSELLILLQPNLVC